VGTSPALRIPHGTLSLLDPDKRLYMNRSKKHFTPTKDVWRMAEGYAIDAARFPLRRKSHTESSFAIRRDCTEVPLINDGEALPQEKKQTLFVIFTGSKKQEKAGTRYIANDGSTTTSRLVAARFWTFWGAKEFAETNHIALNAHTYIDREVFTEFDTEG
jgi:hypothetical protein